MPPHVGNVEDLSRSESALQRELILRELGVGGEDPGESRGVGGEDGIVLRRVEEPALPTVDDLGEGIVRMRTRMRLRMRKIIDDNGQYLRKHSTVDVEGNAGAISSKSPGHGGSDCAICPDAWDNVVLDKRLEVLEDERETERRFKEKSRGIGGGVQKKEKSQEVGEEPLGCRQSGKTYQRRRPRDSEGPSWR